MCSDAAGLARSRTRTYEKDGKRKTCLFSTKGAMPYELFCGRSGQPLVLVFLRENSRKRKFMESYQGRQPSYMRRLSEKREKRKEKTQTEKEKLAGLFR